MSSSSIVVIALVLQALAVQGARALLHNRTRIALKKNGVVLMAPASNAHFGVTEESHIETDKSHKCMCPMGQFWHWRIRSCITQGSWGYECGFFPKEHWHRVCQDGLTCRKLQSRAAENERYFHDGARPATCRPCEPQDKCLMGEVRQKQECLVEYNLHGETCITISITAKSEQKATAEETAKATSTKDATANAHATDAATAEATETDCSQHAVGEEAGIKVKIPVEGTASSKATRAHTAEVSAKGQGEATKEATATAEATGAAETFGRGSSCVQVEDAKKLLGLETEGKVSAVIAARIMAAADKETFESAYSIALSEALSLGSPDAVRPLAEKLDAERAKMIAKLAAAAAAREKAAWVAESNASEEAKLEAAKLAEKSAAVQAQKEAVKNAEKKADELAVEEASNGAKQKATEAAEAIAKRKACAEASEKAEAKEPEAEALASEAADNVAEAPHGTTGSVSREQPAEPTGAPAGMTKADVAATAP